jgi:hypothetical protein
VKKVFIKIVACRDDYSPDGGTLTVGELRAKLLDFDDDLPVYLEHDGGYTYGRLSDSRVRKAYYDDGEDE